MDRVAGAIAENFLEHDGNRGLFVNQQISLTICSETFEILGNDPILSKNGHTYSKIAPICGREDLWEVKCDTPGCICYSHMILQLARDTSGSITRKCGTLFKFSSDDLKFQPAPTGNKGVVLSRGKLGEQLFSPDNPTTSYPILDIEARELFNSLQSKHWTLESVNYSSDTGSWEAMSSDEREICLRVFAGFSNLESLIVDDSAKFQEEVTDQQAKAFAALKAYNETTHQASYQKVIDLFARDADHRHELNAAFINAPAIKAKCDWATRWLSSAVSVQENVVACAFFEGINFSSSFLWLLFMKKKGYIPGVCTLNDYIIVDEGIHRDEKILMYSGRMSRKLDKSVIEEIARGAVQAEIDFFEYAIGDMKIPGFAKADVFNYVRVLADDILVRLGHDRIWNTSHKFEWATDNNISNKVNFFETSSTAYKLADAKRSDNDFDVFD